MTKENDDWEPEHWDYSMDGAWTGKVQRNGNSLSCNIPKNIRDKCGVELGIEYKAKVEFFKVQKESALEDLEVYDRMLGDIYMIVKDRVEAVGGDLPHFKFAFLLLKINEYNMKSIEKELRRPDIKEKFGDKYNTEVVGKIVAIIQDQERQEKKKKRGRR